MARLEDLGGDKWKVVVEVGPPSARARRTRTFTAHGKRAAEAQAKRIEVELTRDRYHLDPQRVTFRQAAEAWWEWWLVARRPTPDTAHEYRRQLDKRLLPDLGDKLVDRLTAGQLTTYYASLVSGGLAASSVRAYACRVRQVLAHCVLHQWAARNAAEGAVLPRQPDGEVVPPTLDQVMVLVREAERQSPMAGRALVVALGLGVRRGELAGMRRSRVLWAAGKARLDTSVTDHRTGRQVKDTKTHQSRLVPMKPWVAGVIATQLREQAAKAERFGVPLAADPWVWSLEIGAGRQPDPGYFGQVFARAEDARRALAIPCPECAAGVDERCVKPRARWHKARLDSAEKRVRLHDMRHGFASWMLAEGVPITEVSGLLGHRTPQTTARIYAHADPTGAGAQAAIDRLPDLPISRALLGLPPADEVDDDARASDLRVRDDATP